MTQSLFPGKALLGNTVSAVFFIAVTFILDLGDNSN